MNLNYLQKQVSRWGRETFGTPNARNIATRMNCEVAELLESLNHIPPAGLDRADALKAIGLECADVLIMLVQVADALDLDLEDLTVEKFQVNRSRSWGTSPNGKSQHIDPPEATQGQTYDVKVGEGPYGATPGPDVRTFVEEGSGRTMELDKYYVLWDAGGLVLPQGFSTTEAAVVAATAAGYHVGLAVPRFLGWSTGWEGADGINVMKGEHLYLWWAHESCSTPAVSP